MVRFPGRVLTTAGPDMALFKSSGPNRRQDIVVGGLMTSIPIFDQVDGLSLALRTLTICTENGLSVNGVPITVTSTCQVKMAGWATTTDRLNVAHASATTTDTGLQHDQTALWMAGQHFLAKTDAEINAAITTTIAGYQRSILASLTVEQLYNDRDAFCEFVVEVCAADMRRMGVSIVSYVVTHMADDSGYIEALGVQQTERVKRDAAEGQAVHQAEARVQEAVKEAEAHVVENKQRELKLLSDKQRTLAQLEAEQAVSVQQTLRDASHAIAEAEQDKILFVKRKEAAAAETAAQVEVLRSQVDREKLEQQRKVHTDADAMLYKATVDADALRREAAAEAEQIRLLARAEASSARAKGLAEADVLRERNMIWLETGTIGAVMEQMAETMPKVAAAIAHPLRNTKKVFVSGGSSQAF